jgi:glycosyltransferase involved in cell wall biosynthesis
VFSERHDDAYLYLHTVVDPALSMGEDIASILSSLQIPSDKVLLAEQYRMLFDPYSPATMAKIYSTLDVLLNPAMGEGLGIPILEAQACGVPAIVTNFSAMQEVCGAGWHVACRPFWTGQGSWQAVADVEDVIEALNQAYALSNSARKDLSQRARRHALGYSVPQVMADHMLPVLEQVRKRFDDRRPVEVESRVAA